MVGNYKNPIRCFRYDKDGQPIGNGCTKPHCTFVHPNDADWDEAVLSKAWKPPPPGAGWTHPPPPPAHSGPSRHDHHDDRDRDRDRNRDKDRDRDRDRDDSRRRRSRTPPRRARTRSPVEHTRSHRRDDRDYTEREEVHGRSRRDPEPDTRRRRDHSQSSIASSVGTAPPRPPPSTAAAPRPPTTGENSSASMTSTVPPLSSAGTSRVMGQRQDGISIPSNHPVQILPQASAPPHQTRMAPPPPPAVPPPMQPPQPLPQVPQGLRLEVPAPAPPEPSKEEKAALWEERIKLFSESTKAHERCEMLQEEHDIALRATKSTLFESLRAEDQERLRGQLTEITRRRDDARTAYQTLRGKLLDTPSWPVAPPPAAREDHERHVELVKYVSELNETVTMMKGLLGEIMPHSHKQPPNPPALSDGESDGGMDIDSPVAGVGAQGAQRSRKRQRVDDAADDTERRDLAQDPNMPTQQELDGCREQLVAFEDQVKSLRNEIAQYELDNAENMAHIVASKAEEIEAARLQEQRIRDRERRERDAATRAKIAETQEKVAGCESDITEMAVDVANMMTDVSKLQIELEEETRRRDESKQKMLQLEERLKGYIATQQTNSATLDTLRTALKAYTTRPPSPPMSPAPIAAPYLLETLREPLLDSVRNEMRPLVEQMRSNVEELVAEKNKLVFEATWTKMAQTLHVLMKIKDRLMESQNQGAQPQPQMQLQ